MKQAEKPLTSVGGGTSNLQHSPVALSLSLHPPRTDRPSRRIIHPKNRPPRAKHLFNTPKLCGYGAKYPWKEKGSSGRAPGPRSTTLEASKRILFGASRPPLRP
jgi:hypothetical protein